MPEALRADHFDHLLNIALHFSLHLNLTQIDDYLCFHFRSSAPETGMFRVSKEIVILKILFPLLGHPRRFNRS